MLDAIRTIGDYVDEYNIKLTVDASSKGKSIAFFVSLVKEQPDEINIEVEDYDIMKLDNYLGEEDYPKGNCSLPFSPVTEFGKTFKSRIIPWFNFFLKEKPNFDYAYLIDVMKKEEDRIIELLEKKSKELNLSKTDTKYLGIKINGKYCGEFQEIFEFWLKTKTEEEWYSGTCSVCCEKKMVAARTGVFKFDTLDKPGFITGGFLKENKWKNIPICLSCRESLRKGKKFVEKKLSYKFYGLSYWLVPKFLVGDKEIVKNVLEILADESKLKTLRISSLKYFISDEIELERLTKEAKEPQEFPNLLTNDINESLLYFSLEKKGVELYKFFDFITLNFLFIRKEQSAERILLLIEDILPSRIREIFNAKVETDKIFKDIIFVGENGATFWSFYPKYFTFGKVRTFFMKTDPEKRESDLDFYFLEIIDAIFRGKNIDWKFLSKFFMKQISSAFVKITSFRDSYYYFKYRITDAMMTTLFLEKLNIIKFNKEEIMTKTIFDEIFESFGKSFETPSKRGLFLLGALTQMLINLQYHLRDSAPMMKKLKSLKMSESDFRALLPEVQNKFIEYSKFGFKKRKLAEDISQLLLEAGYDWKMSIDEMNFYFVCGMNLVDKIKHILDKHYPQLED